VSAFLRQPSMQGLDYVGLPVVSKAKELALVGSRRNLLPVRESYFRSGHVKRLGDFTTALDFSGEA
jgi:hypothetical protein